MRTTKLDGVFDALAHFVAKAVLRRAKLRGRVGVRVDERLVALPRDLVADVFDDHGASLSW
jgi:hypothetical protein